jgi:hypothetical protein
MFGWGRRQGTELDSMFLFWSRLNYYFPFERNKNSSTRDWSDNLVYYCLRNLHSLTFLAIWIFTQDSYAALKGGNFLRTRAWSGSVSCLRLRPQWLVFGELNHFDWKMSKEEKKNPLLSSVRPSKPRPKTEERRRRVGAAQFPRMQITRMILFITAPALSGIIS